MVGKFHGSRNYKTRISASMVTGCVALSESLHFSVCLHFPNLKNDRGGVETV